MIEEALANLSRFVAENSAKAEATAADGLEATGDNVSVTSPSQEEAEQTMADDAPEKKLFGGAVPTKPPGLSGLVNKVPKKGIGLMILIAAIVVLAIKVLPRKGGISHLQLIGDAFLGRATLGHSAPTTGGSAPVHHKQVGGVSSYSVGNNPFLSGWIQKGGTQA